jgi:hypothetical protein
VRFGGHSPATNSNPAVFPMLAIANPWCVAGCGTGFRSSLIGARQDGLSIKILIF